MAFIRTDEGVTLETSASESLYGGQFTLSTQLIKPNYLVILPPTQHHSFFRNLPPLFQVCHLPFPIRQKLRLQLLKYSPSPAGISSWKRNIHWGLCIACCDSLAWTHIFAVAKILQHNLLRDETSYNIGNLNFGIWWKLQCFLTKR